MPFNQLLQEVFEWNTRLISCAAQIWEQLQNLLYELRSIEVAFDNPAPNTCPVLWVLH